MKRRRVCSHIREDGTRCGATPLREADVCFWHSPEHAEAAKEARHLGGLRRRKESTLSGAYDFGGLESVSDIRRLLEIAVLDTLSLENSLSRSRTLAYLAQTALKALQVGELEERIKTLEQATTNQADKLRVLFDEEDEVMADFGEVA